MREPTKEDLKLWGVAIEELSWQVTKSVFHTWFKGMRLDGIDDERLYVSVANDFARDWLQNRLSFQISRMCCAVWGRNLELEFFVRAEEPLQLTFVQPNEPVPKEPVETVAPPNKESFLWGGFEGIKANYTQIPNEFIQYVIPYVSSSVAVLVLMTFRYTVGEFSDRSGNREDEWVTTKKGVEVACNISRSSFYTAMWDARAHGLLIYRPIEDDIERKHLCRKWKMTVEKRQEMFTLRPRWHGEEVDSPDTPRHGRQV